MNTSYFCRDALKEPTGCGLLFEAVDPKSLLRWGHCMCPWEHYRGAWLGAHDATGPSRKSSNTQLRCCIPLGQVQLPLHCDVKSTAQSHMQFPWYTILFVVRMLSSFPFAITLPKASSQASYFGRLIRLVLLLKPLAYSIVLCFQLRGPWRSR